MMPQADPPLSRVLQARRLESTPKDWPKPLDVVDQRFPESFEECFKEGYDKVSPGLIHRAPKLWKTQGRWDEVGVDFKFYAIPGYDWTTVGLTSTADLDDDDAARVRMIKSAVTPWGVEVCFSRLDLTWYGPRERSPANMASTTSDHTTLSYVRNLISGVDYELSLSTMHDTLGNTILPSSEVDKRPRRMYPIGETRSVFMTADFFALNPDTEEIGDPGLDNNSIWVKQSCE